MFSASLLLYSEMKLEFIVTIFSRGCISGGYNEDTEILKLTEKGGWPAYYYPPTSVVICSEQERTFLRAGTAVPGHQVRPLLVTRKGLRWSWGILYPLRYARPPKRGTVMDTTSLKLGHNYERCYNSSPGREVSVGRRGDIHRRDLHHTPSATLVPLREGQLWIQLLSNWGTVMRNARRSCIKIHFPSADDADNADFSSLWYRMVIIYLRNLRNLRMKNRGSSV